MWFYRCGSQKNELKPGNESLMSNNMEKAAASVAPCGLLLFVPFTAVLPITWNSYSKMFDNGLLPKFRCGPLPPSCWVRGRFHRTYLFSYWNPFSLVIIKAGNKSRRLICVSVNSPRAEPQLCSQVLPTTQWLWCPAATAAVFRHDVAIEEL